MSGLIERMSRSCPNDGHIIDFESIVMRHDGQTFDLRLRDQHAIEGIAMMMRQCGNPFHMLVRDPERQKAADLHAECEGHLKAEFSQADLDGRFPRRSQADID